MSMPADQATRDLVSRDGLARTLFVEAGAGTGKTSQLVERIANLVLVAGVRLANIAAITFTEAAAAELQARIRARFESRATETTDDAERERCREAIADLDLAAVSTLHGFAYRLLNEFPVAAGLPPRIRVLDEVSSQLAHEQRWERFVDALFDDPANEALLLRTAAVEVAFEPRYQGHATLKDVAGEMNDNWDRLIDLVGEEPRSVPEPDFGAFDAAVDALAGLAEACADREDLFYVKLTEELLPDMQRVVGIEAANRKLAALVDIRRRKPWGKGAGGRNAAWDGDVKAARARVDTVNEAVEEVVGVAADHVLGHLLVVICREVLAAAKARREDGGLEFHDLLVWARELLRTSGEARGRLHERYTHILLDEFQDTDPIQIELAVLIAAAVAGDGAISWRELPIDDGRLFFVGDPKQSIYRFRRADIALFLAARERFGPAGSFERLTTNFRTVPPILEWVNAFFGAAMAEERGDQQPKYGALTASRAADSGVDHRPVLLGGPHPDPKVLAGALRVAEANDVVRAIVDIRDRPDRWRVADEEQEGTWRDARLADITILLPTRTSLPYLRDALDGAAVPYRLATGTLVYDTQEVRDVLAALRAIDDPTDQLSLVAALRSPLYACSDVDLFTFHHAGGRWNIRHDPPDAVPPEHPVRLAFEHLRSLWEQRWWLAPSAMLDRVLSDRHAFLLGLGDPRPAEVWRRLRFLLDQARAFEEAGGGDLRAFLDWADLQSADSARVHEPLLPETDDDAVRILTIHGAKGLEFPITILSGMTTRPGSGRSGVRLLWNETGPPEVSVRKGIATANHEPRADLELEMDAHEKLRLLYVAATRARDHLIMSAHHKAGDDKTYAGRIWDFFAGHTDLWRELPGEPEKLSFEQQGGAAVSPAADDDREAWIATRGALLERQQVSRVMSATAVARSVRDDLFDEDDDGADAVNDATVPMRRRGRAGSAIGRAVHATLQMLDLAEPRDVEAQARQQCEVESIPELAEQVAKMVRSALESDAVRLAASRPHYQELYVAAPVGPRAIEGYVDLLIERDDGLVVVDYKTDTVSSEAEIDNKLAAYELQGASYAVALEAVTGLDVVDCRFVFCRPGGAVERSVRDLPEAMTRARDALVSDARVQSRVRNLGGEDASSS